MNIFPFSPAGNCSYNSNITTASNPAVLSGSGSSQSQNIRFTNEGSSVILVAFGIGANANAATDTKAMPVLPGTERVFQMPPGTTSVDMVTRSGASSGSFQVGLGV